MTPGKRIFWSCTSSSGALGSKKVPIRNKQGLTALRHHYTITPPGRGWVKPKGRAMAEKKFEEAVERLEEIVEQLETGELPLDQALKIFEEGMRLIKFCSGKLEEAEKKVSLLVREAGGEPVEVPFEPNGQEKGGQ